MQDTVSLHRCTVVEVLCKRSYISVTVAHSDSFLEYSEVFGNMYGTNKKTVTDMLNDGNDVIVNIDVQGAQKLQKNTSLDLVSVFI
jgi:guanylate kinase